MACKLSLKKQLNLKREILYSPRKQLETLGLRASKARGQNFLKDPNYINKIINYLILNAPHNIALEIGPGLGALTIPLLEKKIKIWAVEFDKGLAQSLETQIEKYPSQLTIYNQDILHFNPKIINITEKKLLIFGNLPYNISTLILFWFLDNINMFNAGIFMLQKEMAERLLAPVGTKNYGRLSISLNLWFNIEHFINVPATAFFPKPKIESTIVKLSPKNIIPKVNINNFSFFTSVAFLARRKTLINNLLKKYERKQIEISFEKLNINLKARAETLSPQIFLELYQLLEGDN